jgi:3D-(3,5/4)-trihydroxycyclohexane-1,2-dione acylhydrolase (decyclizing)
MHMTIWCCQCAGELGDYGIGPISIEYPYSRVLDEIAQAGYAGTSSGLTAFCPLTRWNIVVLDNHGFSSIGGLSWSCGSGGFGTEYRYRRNGSLEGEVIELHLAANAASLGAWAARARTREELVNALSDARGIDHTAVLVVETDINERVPGFESWWDVPVAEISKSESVQTSRGVYAEAKRKERYFFQQGNEAKDREASVANCAQRKTL